MPTSAETLGIIAPENLEILIVDDDKIIHLLHSRLVTVCKPGHAVTSHLNGSRALDHIERQNKPDLFFLVFLDLNMPVMNGWQFLEECRKRGDDNIIVVIVTSSTSSVDRLRVSDFPQVEAYCEKPFTRNKMLEILDLKVLKPFAAG